MIKIEVRPNNNLLPNSCPKDEYPYSWRINGLIPPRIGALRGIPWFSCYSKTLPSRIGIINLLSESGWIVALKQFLLNECRFEVMDVQD